jgi:esterase/lipase superfamily enzyme
VNISTHSAWKKHLLLGASLIVGGILLFAGLTSDPRLPRAGGLLGLAVEAIAVLTGLWFVLISLVELATHEPATIGWNVATAVPPIALAGLTIVFLWNRVSGPEHDQAAAPPPPQKQARPPFSSRPSRSAKSGTSSSAPPPPQKQAPLPLGGPGAATYVDVFFATDRAASNDDSAFAASRGTAMTYGHCEVSIPYGHRTGDLERPHWYYWEFREDPAKHVVLQRVTRETGNQFWKDINVEIEETAEKKVLLFVHGYNVSFKDAALRTGQLAFDLDLRGEASRGIAGFYSWPSRGEPIPYAVDENNAEWTQFHLTEFLTAFLRTAPAHSVYLMAHSMGSRPTLRAISSLSATHPELVARIHGLILAAPDIDADTFRTQVAPLFASTRLAGTLYVSSKDKPLGASMHLHGYPRLGDPAAGPVIVRGIETIDASDVDDGDFLGHSYFAARPALLEDIFSLMGGSTAAQRFDLAHVDVAAGRYWKFRPVAQ